MMGWRNNHSIKIALIAILLSEPPRVVCANFLGPEQRVAAEEPRRTAISGICIPVEGKGVGSLRNTFFQGRA